MMTRIFQVYRFYNSQNKQYGDQADLNRPFDYVPLICATSEIVENSRIVDGNITEGFDNIKNGCQCGSYKNTSYL